MRILLLSFFSVLMFFSNSSFSEGLGSMANIFYAEVEVTNVHFSMRINGVELAKLKNKQKYLVELPITSWIKNGENEFSVDVFSLPEEDKIRGNISVDIYLHDESSEYPKSKETYLTYRFPNAESKKNDNDSFYSESNKFNVAESTPTKLWSEASQISSLSEKDKTEIVGLINDLGEYVVDGESKKITGILEYKIQEEAFMRGVDFSQSLKVAQNSFDMLRKHGSLELNRLHLADTRFDMVGGEKIVYVSAVSGKEALSLSLGENLVEIPIYISNLNGRWRIVR